jgi:hypothetical protein
VSSGDEGPASSDANRADSTHGITVSGFTSTPYNISVGGTDFGDSYAGTESTYWNAPIPPAIGSAKSYIPEIPWNDSCADNLDHRLPEHLLFNQYCQRLRPERHGVCNTYPFNTTVGSLLTTGSGSGGPSNCATGAPTRPGLLHSGGTCAGYAKPSWQSVLGNPSDGVRDIPDVSLMAANGVWNHFYFICMSNPAEISEGDASSCSNPVQDWPGFGGTSVSSPIWAGIQALVNQKTGERWGNANTVYYAIANAEYGVSGNASCNSSLGNATGAGCVFHDVTQGSIFSALRRIQQQYFNGQALQLLSPVCHRQDGRLRRDVRGSHDLPGSCWPWPGDGTERYCLGRWHHLLHLRSHLRTHRRRRYQCHLYRFYLRRRRGYHKNSQRHWLRQHRFTRLLTHRRRRKRRYLRNFH